MSAPFTLEPRNPEQFRQETRKSNLIVMGTFAVIAMTLATLSVNFFGNPEGGNFRWNLAGVIAGIIVTTAIFRLFYMRQPWMESARYNWRLKRSLMSLTNIIHQLKAGVEAQDPVAMKAMRFYHQGLEQMYRLENHESALADLLPESRAHAARLEALDIDTDQSTFDPDWVEQLKAAYKKKP
ncbi:hypothetical protein CFI10_15000 [Marinobacterium iners]|nr:hypothetical protein CFI10_15000 [Marinobacterium iners]